MTLLTSSFSPPYLVLCSFQIHEMKEEFSVFLVFKNVGVGNENLSSMVSARVVEESI